MVDPRRKIQRAVNLRQSAEKNKERFLDGFTVSAVAICLHP
jgi:hypothetical protein